MSVELMLKYSKKYEKKAFALNYQIANDPELSGQELRCAGLWEWR